ncbi:MAG: serine hydrolase [Bacteroidales bacterium]|nr:serine hydrolase [Bacteroidales bacterium]
MNRVLVNFLSILLVAAFIAGCTKKQPSMVFPGAEWEKWESPRQAGFDEKQMPAIMKFLEDSMNTTGLLVTVYGKVLFEYGDIEQVSYLASVRKSILSMLYGIYVENGTINLDLTLEDLGMDDIGGLLPIEKKARVRDLISARSGVFHEASNSGDDLASAPERGSVEPGTYQLYSNWDFNAAGAAFEIMTGKNIYDALEEHLAIPLQMQEFDRSTHRKSGNLNRSQYPAYHINLSTRDMARIGHLMLNNGNWNGVQLIPAKWVAESTSLITPLEEMNPIRRRDGYLGYGYMWWIYAGEKSTGPWEGAYAGRGAIGQWITVLPKLGMVVAHKTTPNSGGNTEWPEYDRLLTMIIEASR